jgi:hypothetical protein
MSTATLPYLSLGELGDTLGVQSWRIARLFELGVLPEPPRIGRRRLIPKAMVPGIVDALRDRGWLAHPAPIEGEVLHDPGHVGVKQLVEGIHG